MGLGFLGVWGVWCVFDCGFFKRDSTRLGIHGSKAVTVAFSPTLTTRVEEISTLPWKQRSKEASGSGSLM